MFTGVCDVLLYVYTQTHSPKEHKMDTNTFPAGSEFRIDWTIEKPNPRYIKGSYNTRTAYPTTLSHHKSPVFAIIEDAQTFITENELDRFYLQVRTPGSKRFIPHFAARKA